ncbi:MAG: FIST C-terminal domain-containing protein, partial [Chloroflexi bacterium]|nr:FIST C-terminal domain-containing protein [Chloroflexota bacterium]
MSDIQVVHSHLAESQAAGEELGSQIAHAFGSQAPDALVVFVSSSHDYTTLLRALQETCRPKRLLGCSSAGEFMTASHGVGSASAIAFRSSDMQFTAALGRGLRGDRAAAARQIVASFQGTHRHDFLYRYALVLTDGLAGYADDLIEQLTLLTGGTYQLFGGGAGDDANFQRTHVFFGTEAVPDAAVALEILTNKPWGIGVRHPWQPASERMRVTESDGMRLYSLNATPAVEVLAEHAQRTGQTFDVGNPIPFFLHNVIGIETGNGYKLRVPLAIHPDGSITCAADIPTGATVCLMSASVQTTLDGVREAMQAALKQLDGQPPQV